MSGGQQGGPMMGGGKGGAQAPQGGGKGGPQAPQGHMMPNGQRQTRPGGPPPGRGMPQMQPGQGFNQYLAEIGGMGQPQANFGMPQSPIGTMPSMVKPQHGGGLPPHQNPVGQPQANFGMPQSPQGPFGTPVSPQRQPVPMSGLLAKLYGG
jgi:hypothetical protein